MTYPIKQLIYLLLIVFSISVYAENTNDANCSGNGYPVEEIIKIEKTIQTALKTNNMPLFAEQFSYPFSVNLGHGKKRIIADPQELIDNITFIYNKEEIAGIIIAEKNLDPFCRYDGAAIFGGLWLSTDKDKKIKAFVINASKHATLQMSIPYGIPIKPVDNLQLLNQFSDMYNASHDEIKMKGVESLKVERKCNDTDKPYLSSGTPFAPHYNDRAFLLYHIDINNDAHPEWVLIYPCEGSMCTSGIAGIYKNKGQILQNISFNSNANLRDMLKEYLYINDPVFTTQKGKTVMNFYNRQPPQICSYLWQNNKVILVHGNQQYCFHW